MEKKFEELSLTELKSFAYDLIAQQNQAQNNLVIVHKRIIELQEIEQQVVTE